LYPTGIVILLCTFANAQSQPKAFAFSGYSSLLMQLSDRSGFQTQLPRNFLRWNLTSTLSLYELPVKVSALLTTEDVPSRQSAGYYTVSFRPADVIRRKAREKAAGKFLPRFLSLFPVLEIGSCHPSFTPFTVQGITLSKGVNIEFAPGGFRMAFTTGRATEAVRSPDSYYQSYRRDICAGRIGFGSERRGSLMFTFLSAKDKGSSVEPVPAYHYIKADTLIYQGDTFYHHQDTLACKIKPMANQVASTDYKLVLVRDRLSLSGEMAASLTTEDLNAMDFENSGIMDHLPSWLSLNTTSRFDYAWRLGADYRARGTDIRGGVSRVGPGFFSAGLPFMRNDLMCWQAGLNQAFWQRKLSLNLMYKGTSDNLAGQKISTTKTMQYGITLGLRIPKIPWITVMYMPFAQKNDHPERAVNNTTSLLSINTGYPYVIRRSASANTGITLLLQNSSYDAGEMHTSLKSEYYQLTQNVNVNTSIGIVAALGYSRLVRPDSTQQIYHLSLGNSLVLLKKIKTTLGVKAVADQGSSLRRWSGWMRANIGLNRFSELMLSLEKSHYSAIQETVADAGELIFRINFIIKW